jgi:hypothetical protein
MWTIYFLAVGVYNFIIIAKYGWNDIGDWDFYRDVAVYIILAIILTGFLFQIYKSHRDQFHVHKFYIIAYLGVKVFFIIAFSLYYQIFTLSQKDDMINETSYFNLTSTLSTFVEIFNLMFDIVVILYKCDKDILISFSKVDQVTDLKTMFHKPTGKKQLSNQVSSSERWSLL